MFDERFSWEHEPETTFPSRSRAEVSVTRRLGFPLLRDGPDPVGEILAQGRVAGPRWRDAGGENRDEREAVRDLLHGEDSSPVLGRSR